MPEYIISTDKIISAIVDGNVDASLDGIGAAIKSRRAAINSKKMFLINPGDTIKFNRQCRPKYLQGLTAEVVKINQKRIVVKFSDDVSRRRARKFGFGEFTTPVSLVDKVEV